MPEVFISYSRKDKEFVRKLGQLFNNAKREARIKNIRQRKTSLPANTVW